MWWKILIGFFVLKSISQPTAQPLRNPDIGTFGITGGGPAITSPMAQAPQYGISSEGPMITSPVFQGNSLTLTPPITSPLFDNSGPTKIMQPNPAFGGSQGFQF
jgi:hypothetical protein